MADFNGATPMTDLGNLHQGHARKARRIATGGGASWPWWLWRCRAMECFLMTKMIKQKAMSFSWDS